MKMKTLLKDKTITVSKIERVAEPHGVQ